MAKEVRTPDVKEIEKIFGLLDEDVIVEQVQKRKDVIDALSKKGTIKIGLQVM